MSIVRVALHTDLPHCMVVMDTTDMLAVVLSLMWSLTFRRYLVLPSCLSWRSFNIFCLVRVKVRVRSAAKRNSSLNIASLISWYRNNFILPDHLQFYDLWSWFGGLWFELLWAFSTSADIAPSFVIIVIVSKKAPLASHNGDLTLCPLNPCSSGCGVYSAFPDSVVRLTGGAVCLACREKEEERVCGS